MIAKILTKCSMEYVLHMITCSVTSNNNAIFELKTRHNIVSCCDFLIRTQFSDIPFNKLLVGRVTVKCCKLEQSISDEIKAIKKQVYEIFQSVKIVFANLKQAADPILKIIINNPNTTSVGIALIKLLFNPGYALVRLIGYAIDWITDTMLAVDTNKQNDGSLMSKIGCAIAKWSQEHKEATKVISSITKICVQSVGAVVLGVAPIYVVRLVIDLAVTILRNVSPRINAWIEKHPVMMQIIVTTIILSAQLIAGILTGTLPLAIFVIVLTLCKKIISSEYGKSILGKLKEIIGNHFSKKAHKDDDMELTQEQQNRVNKAKEFIEKSKDPLTNVIDYFSKIIVNAYDVANTVSSKVASVCVGVLLGCDLKEKTQCNDCIETGDTAEKRSNEKTPQEMITVVGNITLVKEQ